MKNYFSEKELACKHCGKSNMDPVFMKLMNTLRHELGFAFPVTSAYRCEDHPVEKRKGPRASSSAHPQGKAMDIAVRGNQAYQLIAAATKAGVPRIGVAKTFIHLDTTTNISGPTVWVYA